MPSLQDVANQIRIDYIRIKEQYYFKALVILHNNITYKTLPQPLDENPTAVKITRFWYLIFSQRLDFYQTIVQKLYILYYYIR